MRDLTSQSAEEPEPRALELRSLRRLRTRPDAPGARTSEESPSVRTKTRTSAEAKNAGPTLDTVKADHRVKTYIRSANQQTGAIGYTEHGERHASTSADGARFILKSLGHDARRCEIAAVAAYLHDIGNVITREKHGQTGALLAHDILVDLNFEIEDVATIMGAIANHEESEGGVPVSAVSAAVIIADKSDVHRSGCATRRRHLSTSTTASTTRRPQPR